MICLLIVSPTKDRIVRTIISKIRCQFELKTLSENLSLIKINLLKKKKKKHQEKS